MSHVVPIGEITFTGSISGQSFERTVTCNTTKVYVMPESAIYWYGNQCAWVTGGWTETYHSSYPASNIVLETNCMSQKGSGGLRCTKNMVSRKGYSKFCSTMKWTSVKYDITYNIMGLNNNTYSTDDSLRSFQHQGHKSDVGEQYTPNANIIYTFKNNDWMDSSHPTEAYVYNGNIQDGTYSDVYAIWFE